MYQTLAFKAQLYLPPESLCTLQFMGQILSGTKKAFQVFEVCPINVSTKIQKVLTIDLVCKKIAASPDILQYLPDEPTTHVTKNFLYAIINTLDLIFFPNAEIEIERKL